ncbi:MAG TPA: DUF1672 family protein [Bacillota bacterium]|nr:DUF1672 family protein [Bacillota bacterium]
MGKTTNDDNKHNENENNETNPGQNYEDAFYVHVQEYKGENFHVEVTIHNIVGTKDGASAFVEAKGEPYFNSIVVIPVDVEKQQVKYDQFTTIEVRVENGIKGGLYVMAYPEEFEKLDQYLEEFAEEYPVTTRNQEVVTHVTGNGYSTHTTS